MVEHEIHLVGSVPLASAAEVFETVAGALGDAAPRIPDGETGPRQGWVRSFDPIFCDNPALARTTEEFRPHAAGGPTLRYRPRDGIKPEDVRFENLPHAELAAAAWRDFRRLKDAGKIPAKTRYLFTIPHPIPLVRRYFAPDLQDAIEPALEAAMYAEIGKICDAIPHEDFAIQWDCASAVFFTLEKGEPSRFGRTREAMYGPIAQRLARAGRAVPAGVDLVYHFCYGNSGGRHSIEPSSTRDAVAMANAVSAALPRDIQMIHTPVPIDRDDDAYFAPLDRLEVRPGTGISLGLIHLSDGIAGAQRRMAAARKHLARFSVGTECGLSCVPPEQLGAMLRLHADVAGMVTRIGRALAWALCAAVFGAAAAAAQPVKIAATGPTATFAPLFMAADKGYFHDEGVEAEILYMGGGTSIPAMIGGSMDYSAAAASSMAAIMKGAKLKVILVGQATVDFQIWSFDPKVTSFDALKGHSLAVVSRGGSEEIATLMYLKANNYPRDFVGFTAIQGPARIAAVTGGTGGYGVLLPNDIPLLAEKGELAKGKMLLDFTKWVQLSAGGLVTSDKEIAEHRDRVLRVIRAVRKGALYVKAFPDSTVEFLQKRNPDSPHQALVDEMKASYPNLNWPGTISREAQQRELSARGEILNLPPSRVPTPEAAYDFSFVAEADRYIAASGWTPTW